MDNDQKRQLYPKQVVLEVTNLCNLKCLHCHFHGQGAPSRRTRGHMQSAVWEKVLDELAEWAQPVSLLTHGAGEPLLYPGLEALLERAGRIPNIGVGFMTNGMLLTQGWIDLLVDLPLQALALSIDGVDPATHDLYRRNADLRTIEANVERLITAKEQKGSALPELTFNMVAYPEISGQERDFVRKWLPQASQVTVAAFRPIGSRKLWAREGQVPERPCPMLYDQCVIGVDGSVGLCCEDIHLDVVSGNVKDERLLDIYNHGRYLPRYRRLHESHRRRELPLCSDCHAWGGDIPLDTREETIDGLQVQVTTTHAYTSYTKSAS
jgi:organic radical activating enzyme